MAVTSDRNGRRVRAVVLAMAAAGPLSAGCARRDPAPPLPAHAPAAVAAAAAALPTPALRADALPLVGRFAGRLPCADCAGIDTELVLASDWDGRALFRLRETYVGGPYDGHAVERDGAWRTRRGTVTDAEAMIYELELDDGGGRRAFVVVDERTIRLLDEYLQPLPSSMPSELTRVGGR